MLRTGNATLDNILTVILSSSMFLAMTLGFVLDNTIPGTDEERGEGLILYYHKAWVALRHYANQPPVLYDFCIGDPISNVLTT